MEKYLTRSNTQITESPSKPTKENNANSTSTPSKPVSNQTILHSPNLHPKPQSGEQAEQVLDVKKHKKQPNESASIVWEDFTRIKNGDLNDLRCAHNYYEKDHACNTKICDKSSILVHLRNQCKKFPFRVEDKKQKFLCFSLKMKLGMRVTYWLLGLANKLVQML
ncbi:hypothetical protein PanWU01x14_070560 [Parasponia andersonii]|uniref:Uncharacterized protein n=1 Tax=Parasponia andersonii TaxID=3476 RepID=A0A2P5DF04_PARAD|nr:hypothetical protein PanWU01x14_070560 [Parasponia andersonii]